MRACFLGKNICTLGYGVATLQMPPLQDSQDDKPSGERPPYPVVMPTDGQEYGRPLLHPLSHPLQRGWKVGPGF